MSDDQLYLSRRHIIQTAGTLLVGSGITLSGCSQTTAITKPTDTGVAKVHNMNSTSASKIETSYQRDRDSDDFIAYPNVHDGDGTINVKFFGFNGATTPSMLITYDMPPGSSEGVHTHNPGDMKEGSFDEFYYIISGTGEMEIANDTTQVKAGDHIFTPNGVPHGIRNTSKEQNLKVFLTAIIR